MAAAGAHAGARSFASAGDDHTIIVWDAVTGRRLLALEGHTLPVTCLLVLPGSGSNAEPLLASGASDRTIRVRSPQAAHGARAGTAG